MAKYGERLRELLDEFPPDMLSLAPARPAGSETQPVEQSGRGRKWYDEWGCLWESLDDTQGVVIEPAIGGLDRVDEYRFPPADDPNLFGQAYKTRQQSWDKFCTGKIHFGIWERIKALRGDEEAMMDLATEPGKFMRLADKVLEYNLELIRQWGEAADEAFRMDGIYITDDFGLEKNMMISPASWREVFKSRYGEMVRAAHEAGLAVQFHSCGDIREIMGDLVEIGIDMLGPLQAPPLSIRETGREFAGEVTLVGFVDAKELMHNGSAAEVAERVIECIETLGTGKGGYIATTTTTVMAETPFENVEAYIRTAGEYRYS